MAILADSLTACFNRPAEAIGLVDALDEYLDDLAILADYADDLVD